MAKNHSQFEIVLSSFFLSGCFLAALFSAGGVIKCFGIMYVAFMEEFNSKAGDAAWIIALCNSFLLFGGINIF